MPVPFLDLVTPHQQLETELLDVLRRALGRAAFVGGSEVEGFEREFAAFAGAKGCVGVNSGTDALRFVYHALGTRPGDEVLTVSHTFIATTESITQVGGVPRFVDVDDATLTMDPAAVEAAITPRTVGIVPVHLYGQPCDMDPLLALAKRHGLWIVEDAAQAHGARYRDRPVGTMGAMAAWSFYPGKNLGSLGEGGAVTGDDDTKLGVVRQLREHGQSRKYYHDIEGYNGRLHAIQAGFLRVKLPHLSRWNEGRRRAASLYRQALADIPGIRVPVEADYAYHVYHLFVIRAERRDQLQSHLTARGIGTGLHYPLPLHQQAAYRHLGTRPGSLPVTERAVSEILSLPMFPELSEAQVGMVADAIREFYRGA
ncbi:MAG TPA: DegT/DnrJ/EryC1/StrS family aminotransferase [Gemmatimonadales bacterium]|jgi:dTDP-4-amino-4,6-dideoxygalactose transaminase|nr:DegT/DnrJ/EryC1/StrS family aminotransferase [Gemmatimonadales bacterium]